MKNEYFKKPRQILAIAKANPYLPGACGTFTERLPVSPSSAPLEPLPFTDKDTVMGSTIHAEHGSGSAQQLYAPASRPTLIDPAAWRCVCVVG